MVTTNYSSGFTSPAFRQTYRMWWVQELLQIHAGMHFPLVFIYMISPLFRSYKNLFGCCPVCIVVECDMTKDVECSKRLLRKETAIWTAVFKSLRHWMPHQQSLMRQLLQFVFNILQLYLAVLPYIDFVGVSMKETYNGYNLAVKSYYDSRTFRDFLS